MPVDGRKHGRSVRYLDCRPIVEWLVIKSTLLSDCRWSRETKTSPGLVSRAIVGSNTSLLIKIGTITIKTFLPPRNKFAYSCNIKICALGVDELLKSIFCILLVVEGFLLQKVVKIFEEVVG